MSVNVGGINLTESIINTELRVGVLERIIDNLAQFAPAGALTQADIERYREEVMADLQKKYPHAGIQFTKKS